MQRPFPKQDAVYLLGTGTVCALGRDQGIVTARLREAESPQASIALSDISKGKVSYFRSTTPGHTASLLPPAVVAAIDDAVAEAGLEDEALAETAVFVGTSSLDIGYWEQRYTEALARGQADFVPVESRYGGLAARIAEHIGSREREFVYNTACTSSANALLHAARMVRAGFVRLALVVGVELLNRISLEGFEALMLLSRDGVRPFDEKRSGLVLGEGVGAIILGGDADCTGTNPLRFVAGFSHTDTSNLTASKSESIERSIRGALAEAGLLPENITAIKAHGTATALNDETEAVGTRRVFPEQLPPLTSIKGSIGHTLGACGALETAALSGCLHEGFLPPTAGFSRPDPKLGVVPMRTPLTMGRGVVLCNYFGFGGNNTSLIIEKSR
ncbi:beta-ketoacyl synthase N-terminal-like domain-containing protein [Thiohalomonas denitrificans]|uniref:beta-ketoacyl synthase N-terminal-like domain-containing protein n=1 Tax=Thiohalomonas denitrificans TaxID=415747 RepID=UPI0026F1748C|nr:beta-ketoacyl synthase N-terminal-like domain-containing protein [Thiohalomonas denitrificans]